MTKSTATIDKAVAVNATTTKTRHSFVSDADDKLVSLTGKTPTTNNNDGAETNNVPETTTIDVMTYPLTDIKDVETLEHFRAELKAMRKDAVMNDDDYQANLVSSRILKLETVAAKLGASVKSQHDKAILETLSGDFQTKLQNLVAEYEVLANEEFSFRFNQSKIDGIITRTLSPMLLNDGKKIRTIGDGTGERKEQDTLNGLTVVYLDGTTAKFSGHKALNDSTGYKLPKGQSGQAVNNNADARKHAWDNDVRQVIFHRTSAEDKTTYDMTFTLVDKGNGVIGFTTKD